MTLTKELFERSGWEQVIASSRDRQCSYYCWEFWKEAHTRELSDDQQGKRLFQLLGDVTSMRFQLVEPDEPFGPVSSNGNRRTATLTDFDDNQLSFFASIVTDLTDAELRGRLADVLWLRRRDYRMGELAVTSYLESACSLEDPAKWNASTERLERAMQLAITMGRKARSLAKVVTHIESVLTRLDGNDPYYFSARMMQLLLDRRVGDPSTYVALAERLAVRAEGRRNWELAREYWSIAAKWHERNNNQPSNRGARLNEAECYVKQADSHLQGTPPSYTLASHWLQQAIEAFRRVGDSVKRIEELHLTLLEYQERSTCELRTVSTSVDLTDVAERAVQHVSGKPFLEALLSLVSVARSPNVKKLREQAEKIRRKYVGQSLFPKIYLNAMGRVIARQPLDGDESLIADMHANANQSRSVRAQGVIEPARQAIISEHNPRVHDFVSILENNRLVPVGREIIVARGLHAGLYGDFLSSAHLLIPQIESSLRFALAQIGVITSAIDDDGVQDEYNINRMLSSETYTEPLTELFGEDLLFDLRGLLVERFGANLRNTLAHGLIDHDVFYSADVCYCWWLALRFYLLPALVAARRTQRTEDATPRVGQGTDIRAKS